MKLLLSIAVVLMAFSCTQEHQSEPPWLSGFEKPAQNPIMTADSSYVFYCPVKQEEVKWQKADVFNPAAVVRNDTVFLLFRAEDNPVAAIGGRTSRIGLAYSTDGINFTKYNDPILYPDSSEYIRWDYPGGCEDPRVVETDEGNYIMMYTSWNKDVARLSSASSTDLINWQKHGPVFEDAYNGRYLNVWSKSGSVVTKQQGNHLIATRIDGKYWMYWGERGVNIAYSHDLTDWIPLEGDDGELLEVMSTRDLKFDSFLTEPGPPAIITEAGIILLYNGKNDEGENADPSIPKGTYCGGQALFDLNDPTKLITRMDDPFIRPDLPHEVTGQYAAGTTFIEGLVPFKNKWFLYYGTADSMVGLAISQ